jgi:hypothetical protein
VDRKTDVQTAVAAVMLLAVVLYFVVPGAIAGLAGNTGSVARLSVAPTSEAPGESVVGGVTLAPETKAVRTAADSDGDVEWTPILPSTSPSMLPPASSPTSTSTLHPDGFPHPQPIVIAPTRPTSQPAPGPAPGPRPTPSPTPTPTPTPTPQSQSITFGSSLPDPEIVGNTVVVDVTATSGLPVTLSSETPAVCSFAGSTLTFTSAGQCTIDAVQAGNASWLPVSASASTTVN